jgi:hypothetical protein
VGVGAFVCATRWSKAVFQRRSGTTTYLTCVEGREDERQEGRKEKRWVGRQVGR